MPQNPTSWQDRKIIFRDISEHPEFWLDDTGAIVNGDCYWIDINATTIDEIVYLALAVANSNFIEKFIEGLLERFNIREIAFDRWGAVQMLQNLEGMGFTVVPFGQGFASMSPPTKELMKLVLEQKISHGGHPVLRWNMDNISIRTDPAGNIKADKAKSTEKIDGAIALIMALDRAIRCGNDSSASVYDERGILLL